MYKMASGFRGSFSEKFFFLRQWVKHPRQFGAILPSSAAFCTALARHVSPNGYVVELGAGTGNLTKALLNQGVPPERLIVVEIDANCCAVLRKRFPHLTIIQGNAQNLCHLLPRNVVGNVRTLVSCLPFLNFPSSVRHTIVRACTQVLTPDGQILLLTYAPISPIPAKTFGLSKKRLEFVLFNLPPASVWHYQFSVVC